MIRTSCVICATPLEFLHCFPNVPIFMGVSDSPATDLYQDQIWMICPSCGCIQLGELIDPNLLYHASHQPGTIGRTWAKHHQAFADFAAPFIGTRVMEIGGGTTTLSKLIRQQVPVEHYSIVDPHIVNDADIIPINMFISRLAPEDMEWVDTIIHSHVMEHFYNPLDELTHLARFLTPTGRMIVSVPVIDKFLELNYYNGLNFEHTYLTSYANLYRLFDLAGFVIDKLEWFSPGNLFVIAQKKTDTSFYVTDSGDNPLRTRAIWKNYIEHLEGIVSVLNSDYNRTVPIYLFGAHVFSQVLLSAGLQVPIVAVLDNDPHKQGHTLYGSNLPVSAPECLRGIGPCHIIMQAAQYSDEIREQLWAINPDIEFL